MLRISVAFACTLVAAVAPAQVVSGWQSRSAASDRYNTSPVTPLTGNEATRPQSDITPISEPSGLAPVNPTAPSRARFSEGAKSLPSDHGQVMREYDIRPYTLRVNHTQRPEQQIVDWILRETGYEAWHSEPLGLLSANRETLRVYHTPEMQSLVADIVDRFVNTQSENFAFSLRIATVTNPNWRARALPLMKPISVQSPGVQGWLLPKENAALLVSELAKRSDYREYTSTQQLVMSGHSIVVSTMRPRGYIRGVTPTQNVWPGFQPEMGQLEEGFSLEFSPLVSLDTASADSVVKLRLNQVEKMLPVMLDVPSTVAPNQRMQVDVPQMTMANLHERFRWPTDQVLLLSMGVVAAPGLEKGNALADALPILKSPPRADALLFVEARGRIAAPTAPSGAGNAAAATASRPATTFQGRY
ncbi:MAG: hypothetical protein WD851_04115 [Pirellulales bacterium]